MNIYSKYDTIQINIIFYTLISNQYHVKRSCMLSHAISHPILIKRLTFNLETFIKREP